MRSRNSKKKRKKAKKKIATPGTYTNIVARRKPATGGGTRKRQRSKREIALTRCPSDFFNTLDSIHFEQECAKLDDGTPITVERVEFPGK